MTPAAPLRQAAGRAAALFGASPAAWITLLIGIALSVAAWQVTLLTIEGESRARFERRAEQARTATDQALHLHIEALHGLHGFFINTVGVGRAQFHAYISSLRLQQRFPGIQAYTFTRHVPASQLEGYQLRVREEAGADPAYPEFTVNPRGLYPDHFVVEYVEPVQDNLDIFGFDLGADPEGRAVAERARDTGEVAITGRMSRLRNGKPQPRLVLMMPVYRVGLPTGSVAQRRAAFQGLVTAVFRVNDLLQGMYGEDIRREIDIEIFDLGPGERAPATIPYAEANLLFDSDQLGAPTLTARLPADEVRHRIEQPLRIGGRTWQMVFVSLPGYSPGAAQWLPFMVLIEGLLISVVVSYVLWRHSRSRAQAEAAAVRLAQQLQAAEERLGTTVSSLNDVIWSVSLPETRTSFISPAAEHIYGYPVTRFYENPDFWYQLVHPDDLPRVRAQAGALAQSGKKDMECRILRADGEVRWIHDRAWLIRGSDGEPLRIDGITRDITERRQTEQELRKLSRAVEQSPASVVITDKSGQIEYANPRFTELTGYSREEVAGSNPGILKSGHTPAEVYRNLWDTISAGHVWSGEILNRKKDGELFWEYEIISPIKDEQGRITHYVAVKEDITQRRRAENAVRDQLHFIEKLIETIPSPVFYKDEQGRYLGCNPAFEEYIGISRENLVGKSVYDIAPKELADVYFEADAKLFRNPGTQVYEARVKYADGSHHDVVFYKATFPKADGGLGGLVGIILDITERKQHESSLRRLNRTLRVLSACNEALVRATHEVGLLNGICRIISDLGGYRFVWVAYPAHDEGKSIWVAAQVGFDGELLDTINRLTWSDTDLGQGVTGTAIRTGQPVIAKDIQSNPRHAPWHRQFSANGIVSCVSLPLAPGGGILGALSIYSQDQDAFGEDEVKLLKELAEDLSYGIASLRTAAERRAAEDSLRLRERAIEASSNGIMITDVSLPDNPIIYVNPAFEQITGYREDEVIGRNGRFLVGEDAGQPELEKIRSALRERRHGRALLRNYHKDGTPFWNDLSVAPVRSEQGEVTHYVSVINDVTARQLYEEELEHQAYHDALSGLANRTLLSDRLRQAILLAHRSQRIVAVLLLDLDHFKMVNDSLGHATGDALLVAAAERLKACVREGDTVARLGGDEFVLVLAETEHQDHVAAAMERLHAAMAVPFHIGGQEFFVTCSIGASLYPRDGADAEILLKNADVAMYRAKEHGRNTFQFFTAEMDSRLKDRVTLEGGLRRALERGEFTLRYQPLVELENGRIVGAEALITWQHPTLGTLLPGRFVPLAEETGLILPIGEWVMSAACRQNKAWQDAGLPAVRISVNLSARQFRQETLVAAVERILRDSGLDPRYLELELTESMMMHNPDQATATLHDLKSIGPRLALDDFGTGYSSLSYLKRFPIDKLKIDRSFVGDITTSADGAAIVKAIIAMAHSLKLAVTAEGVETEEQLAYLRSHRCNEIQGFYFSPPVTAGEFANLLKAERPFAAPGRLDS